MPASGSKDEPLQQAPARSIPIWFGGLLVLSLWMVARPYVGLRHDGILYVGQALLHLNPEVMSQDLFFRYGSQDQYSLTSGLLAAMYSRWGVDLVQSLVPSVCHLLLLGLAYRLLKPLPPLERWLGLAATAVLSHLYGGHAIFAFAERFLTGRTFAEPAALAAILLVIQRRVWLAALMGVLAFALHPLATLPVVIVAWLLLIQEDRRWLWAGTAFAVPLVLAVAGVAPFHALLSTYDPTWWESVLESNGQVLLKTWSSPNWQTVVFDLGVLLLARRLPPPWPRLGLATIATTLVLLAVSLLGADMLHNVLVTQLQVWRVLWLTHLLAVLTVPAVTLAIWREGTLGRLAALAMFTSTVAVNAGWDGGWVFMGWTLLMLALQWRGYTFSRPMWRLSLGLTAVALLGLSAAVVARTVQLLLDAEEPIDLPNMSLLAATLPTVAMPVAVGMLWGWRQGRTAAMLALLGVGVLLAYGASTWDRRTGWTRYVESSLNQEHPFAAYMPPRAQVFWPGHLPATWLTLKRAAFLSPYQSAGLLFNRDTATEYQRRRAATSAYDFQVGLCKTLGQLNDSGPEEDCAPSAEVVEQLCRTPSGPDFMIFERKLELGRVAEWTFKPDHQPEKTFYLYDCLKIR